MLFGRISFYFGCSLKSYALDQFESINTYKYKKIQNVRGGGGVAGFLQVCEVGNNYVQNIIYLNKKLAIVQLVGFTVQFLCIIPPFLV